MFEYFFVCPYCGQEISMLLDLSFSHQNYIEDCEACCNPVQIIFDVQNGAPMNFDAVALNE